MRMSSWGKERKSRCQTRLNCGLGRLLIGWLAVISPIPSALGQWQVGNEAVEQVENLPIYREGVLPLQLSSTDPNGGDLDGTAYLYHQDSLYVVFDQEGPGCVYRIWIRNIPGTANRTIKIYFDQEVFPTISTTIGALFSGFHQNFLAPLVGNGMVSSGGNYCYLPLPFEQHLKIALVGGVVPYQITYHIYPPGTEIASYTSQIPTAILNQWQNTGTDPKPTAGNLTTSGNVTLGINQTQTIFSMSDAGSITGIHLTPSNTTLGVLEGLILRGYWDDSPTPQVECTFGSFFASTLGFTSVNGLPVGIQGNDFYGYFPMPFWQNARLEITNPLLISLNVTYTITYKTEAYPEESGYFCVDQYPLLFPELGQDMLLGELFGHGNVVGLVMRLTTEAGGEFLHGDFRLYLDGQAAPTMLGTDFDADFNAGNYFNPPNAFTLPVHGAPTIEIGPEKNVSAFRFFIGDLIPFGSRFILRSEHGNKNSVPLGYSSVIYSYRRPETALVLSDELDVGEAEAEAAHNYSIQGGQSWQTHYYAYPGTDDNQYFNDQGRTLTGTSTFTVSLDPENRGVRLVRRRDASLYPQRAVVRVAGDSVGFWCDTDSNYYKRWGGSVFEIPALFTQSLSQAQISVTNQEDQWSEYYYWIYSHVPPRPDLENPSQVDSVQLEAQENGGQMSISWVAAYDANGIASYRLYRNDSTGVQPTSNYLIGETPLRQFTDPWLTPGTLYFYRVSAVDFSGNEGPASAEVSAQTSENYYFEGEYLMVVSQSAGDTAFYQNMLSYGEEWSNQAQMFFTSDAVGDSFEVSFEITRLDSYDVKAYFTKGPDYGWVRLKIDGVAIGQDIDLYAPQIERSPLNEIAAVRLLAGVHRLTFKVTGQNAASLGYRLGVDNLFFTSHLLLGTPYASNPSVPNKFFLEQNYPNPFNSDTRIRFTLPQAGLTRLAVYNLSGQWLETLQNGWSPAGEQVLSWGAKKYPSGIYFIILRQADRQRVRKLLLLK